MTMTKENRAEIRTLKTVRREILADFRGAERSLQKQLREFKRGHQKTLKTIRRNEDRRNKGVEHIDRRIAILEGRLA